MPITIVPRKRLLAKKVASQYPDLTSHEVSNLTGLSTGRVNKMLKEEGLGLKRRGSHRAEHKHGKEEGSQAP